MCGRYQFNFDKPEGFRKRFNIEGALPKAKIKTSYNVTPGQELPVVLSQSPNKVSLMVWGLIPFWEEKKDRPHGLINITSEKAVTAGWAKKWIQTQRCLVPASGFYEWKKTDDGKIPYRIFMKDEDYFSFAGLYSIYKHPKTNKEIDTFAILTTEPSDFIKSIHHRMPVILTKEEEETWLNPDIVEIDNLKNQLHPFKGKLEAYPISKRINNPIFNDPDIIKPT